MRIYLPLACLIIFGLIIKLSIMVYLVGLPSGNFSVQQDNYATYARALYDGKLHTREFDVGDHRLFPGYPVIILLLLPIFQNEILAGLFITFISYIVAIILFWKLTKNMYVTGVFLFFPPIWFSVTNKVATEPLIVMLLLGALYAYLQKNYYFSGFILGIAFDVRLIAICLLFSFLIQKNNISQKAQLLFGFGMTASLLFIYNIWQFGIKNIFLQFALYPKVGKGTVGVIQLVQDLLRTLDWHQYHIFISGLLYITVSLMGLCFLYTVRKRTQFYTIYFWWAFFSLLFVLFFGPTPLLEEFGRFLVPFFPALLIGYATILKMKIRPI